MLLNDDGRRGRVDLRVDYYGPLAFVWTRRGGGEQVDIEVGEEVWRISNWRRQVAAPVCVGSRSTHTSVVFFFVFSYERFWLWGLTQVAILENLKIGLPVAGPGCLGIGTSSDLYLYPDAHARTDPFGPFDSPGLYRTFLCFVCICYIRLEGARVWKLAPP